MADLARKPACCIGNPTAGRKRVAGVAFGDRDYTTGGTVAKHRAEVCIFGGWGKCNFCRDDTKGQRRNPSPLPPYTISAFSASHFVQPREEKRVRRACASADYDDASALHF